MKTKNIIIAVSAILTITLCLAGCGANSKAGVNLNGKPDTKEVTDTTVTITNEDGTTSTVTIDSTDIDEINDKLVENKPETVTVKDEETGHTHNYKGKISKNATCDAAGEYTYTCSECGNKYTEIIVAIGHQYATKVVAPTATEQGYTLHTCSVCGLSYKDNYKSATGTTAANHSHNYNWKTTKLATCTENGISTGTCTVCGFITTKSIPKTGHKWVERLKTIHHEAEYYEVDVTETWQLIYSGWWFWWSTDNCYFGPLYWVNKSATCDHNNEEYRARYIKQSQAVNADSTKEEVADNWRILDEMAWNRAQELEKCGCIKIVEWMAPSVEHDLAWDYYFNKCICDAHMIGDWIQETKSVKVGTKKVLKSKAYDSYEFLGYDCSVCGAHTG